MFKVKRVDRPKKPRRTSLEIEEQSRTLYVRIPHTIKNVDEIKNLFFGDIKVKLPRQSSRHCHVIFSTVDEKIKNLKAVKKQLIDGKPIFISPPKPMNLEKKPKHKKIKIPDPTAGSKTEKYIFISKIPPGVKASELREAFPGSVTVALLKGLVNGKRNAKMKMSSPQLCLHYSKKENWPIVKEQKVSVYIANKPSSSKNRKRKKVESLKKHNEKKDQKEQPIVNDSDSKKTDLSESDEDEVSEEEDENTEEDEEEPSSEEK
ncbi:uncharacterized protein LOC131666117 [Phymastichus coffea]|uniref:uncharacterized protein LOC131666117 n=1 Tax=Phymastichus coffea TaxID=108790 RepID=UPI00273B5285|nr:uncharacterized protein LOC131666117 [Phymastichus coffea]